MQKREQVQKKTKYLSSLKNHKRNKLVANRHLRADLSDIVIIFTHWFILNTFPRHFGIKLRGYPFLDTSQQAVGHFMKTYYS